MNGLSQLLPVIARAAVVMFVTMLVIRGLLWLLSIRSPAMHRWASVLVLLQGWLIAPLVIAVPWYDPAPSGQRADPTPIATHEFAANVEMASVAALQEIQQLPELGNFVAQPSSSTFPFAITPLLTFLWLGGMSGICGVVVLNYLRFCLAAAARHSLADHERQQWRELLQQTNGPATLPLRLTPAIGPILCLLPRGYQVWIPRLFWQACTLPEQAAILRHELSHYRRGDVWKTWLMYLLALPQWFNPAAWWAVRNFQEAGEWLCDLDAAEAGPRQTDYLQALLRLVELHPSPSWSTTVAGQCAHAHPLLVRVRRLLSPSRCQDSLMNKFVFSAVAVAIGLLPLVRIELVARAADPPASLLAVKDRMTELDGKLQAVKEELANLQKRGEEIKATVGAKAEELKKLAEDPNLISAELREKAKAFMDGDEPAQLAIVKDLGKLASQDEQILALGRVIKDSPHEAVRRLALQTVLTKGEAAYPAIALSFETLENKDRGFLALELNKLKNDDKLILFLAMAKNADEELLGTLMGLDLPANQRLLLLSALADSKKEDETFAAKVLELGDKGTGDDGLLLLYAVAKMASPKHAAAAVKLAVKRKADAWPVIAAAYKKEDKDCRAAVVRAAKELGGEGGDFLVKSALEDGNADLRAAAEEAVK